MRAVREDVRSIVYMRVGQMGRLACRRKRNCTFQRRGGAADELNSTAEIKSPSKLELSTSSKTERSVSFVVSFFFLLCKKGFVD